MGFIILVMIEYHCTPARSSDSLFRSDSKPSAAHALITIQNLNRHEPVVPPPSRAVAYYN